ncbi:hypothetical protein CPB84DRAFT_1541835 [Gymnopilus junonius]|uniref:Uncharacterized protein n=1 Tax=Gymnopilus junonius TaxID=109634 RepID=A0A9P5N6K2_GYMJU|nr:hypothetical protein CPB84DRAFT_1541835 [Gymnopilus junonius]
MSSKYGFALPFLLLHPNSCSKPPSNCVPPSSTVQNHFLLDKYHLFDSRTSKSLLNSGLHQFADQKDQHLSTVQNFALLIYILKYSLFFVTLDQAATLHCLPVEEDTACH